MAVSDPFVRAWNSYDSGGLAGLNEREAPLAVITPDIDLAKRASSLIEGLQPGDLRWMILVDAYPVVSHGKHLDIVGSRPVSYLDQAATNPEVEVLSALTRATAQHVQEVAAPQHGAAIFMFGQQVPTMHMQVVARHNEQDGLNWDIPRQEMPVEARHEIAQALSFDQVPGRAEELQMIASQVLEHLVERMEPKDCRPTPVMDGLKR
ncbi:MAG TPA: hypothetical protein VGS08_02645 [Candidatus Saccharimonadales bacterium]|nr:hypothetical protein [Candidatus Saccharimonadales bacterium]